MSLQDQRRRIPQVERLVNALEGEAGLPRPVVVDAVRTVVDALRRTARRTGSVPTESEILDTARAEIGVRRDHLLRPVVNATGVVLHTNLGRAPLAPAAVEAVVRVARGYSNLELDLGTGKRGDRYVHVEPMLALATGAEAALVVNNNAAAVLLVCAALARGREVIISRGELIEIGGEFRIPEVLAESGAIMREVGTTNRTHLRDYERAIGDDAAFVLRVHPSNYRVVGFTKTPATRELADLAHRRGVPLVYDAGSGLVGRELADEPAVGAALDDGADLVCFSGDKLLGGPQAGIVCGRAALVTGLRRHPLLRALRPGKMTLAALAATVAAYLEGGAADLPVWRMIDAAPEDVARRARSLVRGLRRAHIDAEAVEGESVTGGGSLPGAGVPTTLVRIPHRSPDALARALRAHDPPVLARVEDRALVLDLRTVAPLDDALVGRAVRGAASTG